MRVSRAKRDGTLVGNQKKPNNPDWHHDFKAAARAGYAAARRGEERWMNPFTYTRARCYTWGWERSHGVCEGCAQCGPAGTRPAEASFSTWLARFERRNVGYVDERRHAQGGRTRG